MSGKQRYKEEEKDEEKKGYLQVHKWHSGDMPVQILRSLVLLSFITAMKEGQRNQ